MLSRYCADGDEDDKKVEQGSLENLRRRQVSGNLVPSNEIVTNCIISFSKIKKVSP
jgi:hypothetical protein